MKPAAIRPIFAKYNQEIESFLARRLACPEAAADLTQEVFLRLMRTPTHINSEIGNMRAYLYKMATNIAINHKVSEQRRERLWEESIGDVEAQIDTLSPERIVSDKERLERMAMALKELPALTQQVFVLTRIKGMKQAEVAAKLNIHITTVEKNLSKAVRHCYARTMDE